ncbi:ecotin [Pseudomonas agarici]|uniref:Ecotin n=1 Tax=Pseudomonas agarici TaxID=46677 RepID=A0A0X1SYE8_PSEAA|nr:serine protease inhibitor ecotin [Pseudomonas agarici]AMB84848.1 ecotin [Pseudomonas agarici]NWB90124.1 serine protease inhibitor ecotin [Pseudomonas agarici]NWC09912.1 serine protease inhibitor ecotin [Pseudomonas agarici]SEL56888.1 ecotin [Pseudomonas agarici]
MNSTTIATTFLLALTTTANAVAADKSDLAPFPKAEAGFTRTVIRVPKMTKDADHRVEIIAGKILPVDCNQKRLSSNLDEKNLEGWGYSYYRLESVSGPMSTLMACPPGTKSKKDFVPVIGTGYMLRYNSKLPLVIYAPDDVEIRYRIWTPSKLTKKAVSE